MKTRIFKTVSAVALTVAIMSIISCSKRSYLYVADDPASRIATRYKIKTAFYETGRSIVLTDGKYEIRPGDSTVLFVEGSGSYQGSTEEVASLSMSTVARFYCTLPANFRTAEYSIGGKSIAEIINPLRYRERENLFVCQSGTMTVDSIKGEKIFGRLRGAYVNTSNAQITVDGALRADRR